MQAVVYIGDRLKDLRIEQAITQRELADKAGIGLMAYLRTFSAGTSGNPICPKFREQVN